jgi:hypothetical protein
MNLALRLVAGQPDAATVAWLRAGFLRCFAAMAACRCPECLHMGNTPRRVRLA